MRVLWKLNNNEKKGFNPYIERHKVPIVRGEEPRR
jgi:hypothetical protein